ncbi:hypothetical protein BC332_06844 [Capsicum chinense]|nr:hypothetical protein BC332_06844 [Capsicum chinense]
MDNPPSFSLGITQLDATVQDIPLEFVPATFDEQDPDWIENHSKHRNDHVTMKKLKDKTTSKSKKSTSKASKKKFDDSGQPRLPKLDLSFSKNFEIRDPTTYASTFDFGKLKRTTAKLQQCVGTIAEEFGNFSTIPSQKILIKAGFKSPVSPDQPLKKKKTVMFEQDHQMVMDDDTSGRVYAVHHGSDLYRETQKNATDKKEIGVSKIQRHHHGEIDVSPQSHQHKSVPSSSKQHEGTSKSSLDGDEIKNYINKCHENYAKGSINDMEVSRDEESNKHHILEEQQLLDVNAANKDAGHEDDFENEGYSDLEALEDEVGGTITDSIQATVDTILFDSQIPPDFPDAQVRELQASKVNAPSKRERKKSRILRSPYISKYGSGSKDSADFDKEEKLKYAFDGYTTTSCFFKSYVEKTHTRYYPAESAVELSTQQDYTESIVVAKNEDSITNIIHGFCIPAGLPYYMVDEELWRICCAYAEILSEGLQVHSCGFDAASQRARYASLLWHYGVKKTNEGYTSDNGEPPRPKKSVIEEIEASAIVTLE